MRFPGLGFILFFFFSLACSIDGRAQSIDDLLDKAKSFNNASVDSALVYVDRAKELAVQEGDTLKLAEVNNLSSYVLLLNGQHDRAIAELDFNLKALPATAHELKSETFYNLGSAYYLKEVYDQAIANYLSAIEEFQITEDRSGLAKSNLQVGVIYEKLDKMELANYFYDRSISSSKSTLQAHPTSANSESSTSAEKEELSSKMLEELGETPTITKSFVHYNLGLHLKNTGGCEEALDQFRISLDIKEQLGYRSNVAKSHILMADCLIELGRELEALDELYQAKTYSNERLQIQQIEQLSAQAYSKLGNVEEAFEAYIRYTNIKDSIATLAENERIASITAQFETEKQAKEIELLTADNRLFESQLSRQRLLLVGLLLVALLIGIAVYLFYQRVKTKRQLEFLEVNRQLLQTQLNPHFLFNALNGIKRLVRNSNQEQSSSYIQNFSGLMRNILENTTEKFVPVEEDIETIRDYLALQQLVHDHQFEFELEVDPDLEIDLVVIPPMFTQPFVENAVVHGVSSIQDGKIQVSYRQNSENLEVLIIDNGPGMNRSKAHANAMHKSMATSIIDKRKEYLSKTQGYPIHISTDSSDSGVKISLVFPLNS